MTSTVFNPAEIRTTRLSQYGQVLSPLTIFALLVVLYASVLKQLVLQWVQDPNYGHGFLVPCFAAYVLWRTRREWRGLAPQPSSSGLALMLLALAMLTAGMLGAELFVSRLSLLILLAGLMVFHHGWKTLKAVMFPLGYLIFMIPLPAIIFYQIAFPLQLLASRFAATSLDLLQVPALREGNLLILPNATLQVAEACSGIRSLFSLLALAVAFGYLTEKSHWRRLSLAALMVPVAVVSNGLRLTATGVLTYFAGPKWTEGYFHLFAGWLVFLIAVTCMIGLQKAVGYVNRGSEANVC